MPGLAYAAKHSGATKGADGAAPEPGELALKLRWVRGIESNLNDLVVRGERFTTHFGDALLTGTLRRKIVGASEIKIVVSDPFRRLLNKPIVAERHELELDGLKWLLVKISGEGMGQPMTLTYEPRVVAELKKILGPIHGRRELMTRAEFGKKLTELLPEGRRPRFISPRLHDKIPIKTDREAKRQNSEAEGQRGRGLSKHDKLQYAGSDATPAQMEVGEIALRTAESNSASTLVMEALVIALMDESGLGSLTGGTNVLQGEGKGVGAEIAGVAKECSNFLRGEGGYGQGAIEVARANPTYSPAEIATTVQRNQAFLAGGLSAGAEPYERFTSEAREWVEAWGGGAFAENETITKRYEFKVGAKENAWQALVRVAGEVHWRCFESAGWIYFIDEIELLKQKTLMKITPYAQGFLNLKYDHDEGKENDEITVTAWAKAWEAPPGTMVEIEGWGPNDGTYLVSTIEAPLAIRDSEVTITLKRPHKPLLEPAAETETKSLGGATGNAGNSPKSAPNAPAAIDAGLAEMEAISGTPYVWGGGHESADAVKTRKKGYDCSGAMSRVLFVMGVLDEAQTSGTMASEFEPGKGEWFVLYANANHVWCEIKTKDGWVEWEEGGTLGNHAGFLPAGTQSSGGYSARHPKGL